MREQWIEAPRMEGNKSLAGKFGISPLTVRLIRNRAGESEEAVRTYLWGDLDSLGDAGQMKGMKEAAALLERRRRKRGRRSNRPWAWTGNGLL